MAEEKRKPKKRLVVQKPEQIFPEMPRQELTEAEAEKLRRVLEEIEWTDEDDPLTL